MNSRVGGGAPRRRPRACDPPRSRRPAGSPRFNGSLAHLLRLDSASPTVQIPAAGTATVPVGCRGQITVRGTGAPADLVITEGLTKRKGPVGRYLELKIT